MSAAWTVRSTASRNNPVPMPEPWNALFTASRPRTMAGTGSGRFRLMRPGAWKSNCPNRETVVARDSPGDTHDICPRGPALLILKRTAAQPVI